MPAGNHAILDQARQAVESRARALLAQLQELGDEFGCQGILLNKSCNKYNSPRIRVAHGLWVPINGGGTVHPTSRNKLEPKSLSDQAAELAYEPSVPLERLQVR